MMSLARYHAAACQTDMVLPRRRDEIARTAARMAEMVDHAVVGYSPFFPVKLIVFPEFALCAPVYASAEELSEKLAMEVPNEHTDRLAKKAREHGVHLQCGSQLECDPRWPDRVFNTTLLIGPEGVLAKYRKVNPWIPWEVHTSPHDLGEAYDEPLFPVTETELGRLGVATCYDWLFPEVTRELAAQGAEVLIRISAYMDPWGATPPMDWWTLINRVRALENMAAVVAANQGASLQHYPPFSWPGSSQIVDHDGRLLGSAAAGPGEAIVVAPVELASLRDARATRSGHHLLAHLRPDAYRASRGIGLEAGPDAQDQGSERLQQRIDAARRRLPGSPAAD